jgi:hypothetical protein
MHRPAIAGLSSNQRQELITKIREDKANFPYKGIALEALSFCDELIEELRGSKVSIGQLKKILEDRSEQLKKLLQNH